MWMIRGVLLIVLASQAAMGAAMAQAPPGLRVVVVAGEDAVNIIQQKTAIA